MEAKCDFLDRWNLEEEDPDCNFFSIASRLNSWGRQLIGTFFWCSLPWSGVPGCRCRGQNPATKRWFASPFPALLPVLSCFFLDIIKETYNKNHIIFLHCKKTPFTFVSCVLFCKKHGVQFNFLKQMKCAWKPHQNSLCPNPCLLCTYFRVATSKYYNKAPSLSLN